MSVVLRSGTTISGPIEQISLTDGVAVVDGWTIRLDEIAGTRLAD